MNSTTARSLARKGGLVLGLALSLLGPASAADAPLGIEAFTQGPIMQGADLSPSGKRFSVWTRRGGTQVLITRPVGGGEPPRALLTVDDRQIRVHWTVWANEERLIVCVSKPAINALASIVALSVDGAKSVDLVSSSAFPGTPGILPLGNTIVDMMPGDGKRILVQVAGENDTQAPDVYEVELDTGAHRLVHKAQSRVRRWFTDAAHRVRVGLRDADPRMEVLVSDPDGTNWRTGWSYAKGDEDAAHPLGFGADPHLLYISAVQDGRRSIFEMDLRDPALPRRLVLDRRGEDTSGSLVREAATGRVIGVSDSENSTTSYWDPAYRGLLDAIDKALPDRRNKLIRWSADGGRYLVASEAGNQPVQYLVGDRRQGQLGLLAESIPSLHTEVLSPQQELTLKSRDGAPLALRLTTPRGPARKPWPTVVLAQGLDYKRQTYVPFVQWLASQGVLVAELGARNHIGMDRDKATAGTRLWLEQGHEDVVDAVAWLVGQGTVDPQQVCAAGHLFGAQAVLLAAARSPASFKCVVAREPITDLVESGVNISSWRGEALAARWVGSIRNDVPRLKALSPLTHAGQIKADVLMLSRGDHLRGSNQAEEMLSALKSAGTPARLVLQPSRFLDDQETGTAQAQRLEADFFRTSTEFLRRHLLGGKAPTTQGNTLK